ncbi:MAG: KH domain-containing protein [archaeon]
MKTIISEKLPRIIKNKKRLEEILNVKITNRGKEVFIEGSPEGEYIAEKVIDALEFGFPFSTAILIKKENLIFEILSIKEYTRRKDFKRIRARIIGKKGKTLKTLCELTKCYFELKENFVGIIGPAEYIKNAQDAMILIIQGSKQANIYKFLEKNQIKEPIDLGLKK